MLHRLGATAALLLLSTLAACGDAAPAPGTATASATLRDGDPRLHLVPERVPALVGQPLRLRLLRGDLDDGATLARVADRFDPVVARVGGTQHNDLEVDVEDGVAGVTHTFDLAGDAMVGFSTEPRLVAWPAAGGGTEDALLSQCVKCLLFVSQGGRDVPEPSAALSSRIGLRLEVVPMMDPLPLLPGEQLPLRVRFDGPGLPGVVVNAQRTPPGGGDVEDVFHGTTDSVGTVLMPIGAAGRYLVTVLHEPDPGRSPRELYRGVLVFDVGAKR